jgi:hypothetical protein
VVAGELAKAEKRCEAMRLHLAALNQTLRLMGYEGDPADIKPIRRNRRLFLRGELQRLILDALRTAGGPVSNSKMVLRVIEMKGWDAADAGLACSVAGKVRGVRKRLLNDQQPRNLKLLDQTTDRSDR